MATATVPATATEPPAPDVISRILKSIDKVPQKSRAGLIGVVLYVVLSVATMKLLAGTAGEIVIGVLGIAGAMIVMSTGGRNAYTAFNTVLLLGFCWLLLAYSKPGPPPAGPEVVQVDTTSSNDTAEISGNVRYVGTHDPVAGAFIDVDGFGDRSDTTSESGYFAIRVPRWIIRQRSDSVMIAIRTASRTNFVVRSVREVPLRISVPPLSAAPPAPTASVAPAAMEASDAARARAWLTAARTLPPVALRLEQERFDARFILDSVRTLHDGTKWGTWWRFEVRVNDTPALSIPQRTYDRTRSVLRLGGEVPLAGSTGTPVSIQIRGLRDAFIGVHQIVGQGWVHGAQLRPEQPVPYQLRVVHERDRDKGEFIFYYTVIRRGTPNLGASPPADAAPRPAA
jgi:hypothetical protein